MAKGAPALPEWPTTAEIRTLSKHRIPAELQGFADRIMAAWQTLDANTLVFGQFDTHGWNMAFDIETGELNGVFDFADGGVGPLALDLSYPSFISPDLTTRVTKRYRQRCGRPVELKDVLTAHAMLRLVEALQSPDDGDVQWRFAAWRQVFDD